MFSNSRNLLLNGGTYTDNRVENHINDARRRGIDLLLEASSPGAFHNSGERFDPPKCHPNTRIAILTEIINWITGKVGLERLILWLYGPAGAGKSAILQTIAELCYARGILLASYFFSRTDPKRNNEKHFVASLAYQVAVNIPQVKDLIDDIVDKNPAIFQLSVQAQLATLIIAPLSHLSQIGIVQSTLPRLIIIDGLDECHGAQVQKHIIHEIAAALSDPQHSVSIKFLIASRPEQPIVHEFSTLPSEGLTKRVPLDNTYQAYEDIERYLKDSFHRIKTTHPFVTNIPSIWPTNETLATLVRKSSGQFIYAATVIKYISSTRHLPTKRLEIILGLRPPRNDMPFAELDALYIGILSSVEDLPTTLRVLGVLILGDLHDTPEFLEDFMFLDRGDIRPLLIDLASVINYIEDDSIQILHASFPDFLLDPARSKEYHINPSSTHAELAQLCIKHINLHDGCKTCLHKYKSMARTKTHSFAKLVHHASRAEPTTVLREEIFNICYITSLFKFSRQDNPVMKFQDGVTRFLSFLKTSNLLDTKELYLHHRKIWDMMTHQRLAGIPSGLELDVYLVLLCLSRALTNKKFQFPTYLHPKNDVFWLDIYLLLPGSPPLSSQIFINSGYCILLEELLTDPSRAGKYFIDGNKYAVVAKLLLGGVIRPYLSQRFFEYFLDSATPKLLDAVVISLSKAGPSDDLIAVVNHTNLVFHKRCRNCKYKLRRIVEGICAYLKKFHGSVPTGLRISIDEEGDDSRWEDGIDEETEDSTNEKTEDSTDEETDDSDSE